MKEEFDFEAALDELERIAVKAEDPQTGLGDIETYIGRTRELVEQCRAYLRGASQELDRIDSQL